MKLCSRQLQSIGRRKKLNLGKIGKRRRFKRVATGRNSNSCLNQTQAIYIPLDIQINRLLRLPVKSLLRFRCVSKLWSNIIASRGFRNRHATTTRSLAPPPPPPPPPPPRLLVSLGDFSGDKLAIFSYPNPEGDASVPYRDLSLLRTDGAWVCGAVRGLICFRSVVVGKVGICNPSTRQVQLLPELRFNHRIPGFYVHPHYFLGHDPVEDQYKMVAIDIVPWRLEHKIVVVGGGVDWKETPCAECPHSAQTRGICMNGFIYYGATRKDVDYPDNSSVLVCFDVRLEKFSIINVPVPGPGPVGCQGLWFGTHPTLINYRGKVGVVEDPKHGAFRMWVLEDAEKQEWPMVAFLLPKSAPGPDCLVPSELSVPFCLHYYNLERNSIRKVRIQGLPVRKLIKQANRFSISVSDHSESFMF